MALIHIDHSPSTVKVNLPLNILVPEPGKMNGIPIRERKVLYLLHGLGDDASAWQRYTTIETLAAAYGLVVVMPSVGRSFYTDLPNGQCYFTYLVDELPKYLMDVFDIQPRRENTFIAGLSMGGYGAMKAALLRPERYFAAGSFSGVLSLEFLRLHPDDRRIPEFAWMFGDLSKIAGGENDPMFWLEQAAKDPAALPRLFVAVGRQEDMYPINLLFRAACQAHGIPLDYHEEDGRHEWPFWEIQIRRFLAEVLGEPTGI